MLTGNLLAYNNNVNENTLLLCKKPLTRNSTLRSLKIEQNQIVLLGRYFSKFKIIERIENTLSSNVQDSSGSEHEIVMELVRYSVKYSEY